MGDREASSSISARESHASHVIRVAILERLTMLATPQTANAILRTALTTSARRFVPESGCALDEFVRGALRRSTESELGSDYADALMDDLTILVKAAPAAIENDEDSRVRMTSIPSVASRATRRHELPAVFGTPVPTVPPPVTASMRVIFASRSVGRLDEVAAELGSEATVHLVSDVFELVDLASAPSDGPVIILVDRASAALRTSTLAAAEEELPEHAHVVLWGDGVASNDEMPDLLRAPESWTRLDDAMSIREVATILRQVGRT